MPLRGRGNADRGVLWLIAITTVSFTKIFSEKKYFEIAIDNLKSYREKYKFLLLGYVTMPEHVHFTQSPLHSPQPLELHLEDVFFTLESRD